MNVSALIADDEPLLREGLRRQLAQCWPELAVVAEARNGLEALEMFRQHKPSVCFLDVQMPGLTGVEVAQHIGRSAHLVFVTAFDQYALQAFDEGAIDYLVKPVRMARLASTVARLRERVVSAPPQANFEALLLQLASHVRQEPGPAALPIRWLRCTVGQAVRLIPVQDIEFIMSDEKYTRVAWRDGGNASEALIRTPLRELAAQLDPQQFQQIHRAVIVNLTAVRQVVRGTNETANLYLKDRPEVLPVSRTFLHLFKAE